MFDMYLCIFYYYECNSSLDTYVFVCAKYVALSSVH